MPFDLAFTSQSKSQKNRRNRKFSEDELTECRALLALPPPARMKTYNADKQILYTRATVSPGHQLFVDKVDQSIKRASKRWGKFDVLNEEIDRIKI